MVNHTNVLYLIYGKEKILLCPICAGHMKANFQLRDGQIKETIRFKPGMKLKCSRCNRLIGELTTHHE